MSGIWTLILPEASGCPLVVAHLLPGKEASAAGLSPFTSCLKTETQGTSGHLPFLTQNVASHFCAFDVLLPLLVHPPLVLLLQCSHSFCSPPVKTSSTPWVVRALMAPGTHSYCLSPLFYYNQSLFDHSLSSLRDEHLLSVSPHGRRCWCLPKPKAACLPMPAGLGLGTRVFLVGVCSDALAGPMRNGDVCVP